MSRIDSKNVIQYVPFISFVHPSFWHTFTEIKLDIDKLCESSKQIYGRFTYRRDIESVFEVDGTSFNKQQQEQQFCFNVTGIIMNKNTIEDFKIIDKAAFLNSVGETMWSDIKKKLWIANPSTLLHFVVLSFADLKKFHYFYWFAFPSPSQPTLYLKNKSKSIASLFNEQQLHELTFGFNSLPTQQQCYFAIVKENDRIFVKPLTDILKENEVTLNYDLQNIFFTFADPASDSNPGWPLRIFMAALLDHCSHLRNVDLQIIGLRFDAGGTLNSSQVFTVTVPEKIQSVESAGWVGWERNDKGNFGPKLANMSASMDPVKLADASSDLNIKLMKWRLVPKIDIEIMKTTKCLLLGAGTLGCHIARDLLAWGFRHITFIDNGKVSYSNPTRQVLFTHQDCIAGGRKKAEAAAENLKLILPTVKTKGIVAHIPMPGHPVGESLKAEVIANIATLTEAIEANDVIFLLLDTREARWLPTLIAAHYGKIVINAALGFDSYLVIRHGVGLSKIDATTSNMTYVPGGQLGCYFCNDVTAPGNSVKDRTLDQQCTVTRPGVAAIAGALAVEILVALLQHPHRVNAPAVCNLSAEMDNELPEEIQSVLGPIPHSIRGFLHSYQTVLPTCVKFKQCIACSDIVLNKYREDGIDFLIKVFNSGSYLEEVTGLSEMHITAEMTDILTLSESDDEN